MSHTPDQASRQSRFERRWRTDGAAVAVAVTVAGVAALLAAQGVSALEAAAFHAVNGLPDVLFRPMWAVQFLGVLLVPAVVAVVAALFRKWRLALVLVLLIPLKLLVEKGVIKNLVYRARPGTSVCDQDTTCLELRDVPLVGPSFPSGHVIIAFGIAWLVAPYVGRRGRWALAALCLLVAFARIYLGAHNPLDVVAGAAAGIGIAAVLNLVVGVPASWRLGERAATGRRQSA
jgi:membrane-associated phospholipid phosphatase